MVLVPLMDEAQSGAKPRAAEETVRSRVFVALAIVHAVALVWLIAAVSSSLTLVQCFQAYLVLISLASAAFGLRLLRISARLVVIAGIAWFVSPVLLANVMISPHGSAVTSVITRYHPLFALNRVVIDQGAWSSSEFAYQYLTPLGQDVPYILPESVWPCVVAHALVTAGCASTFLVFAKWGQRATVPC
jgi:hypothetical protein